MHYLLLGTVWNLKVLLRNNLTRESASWVLANRYLLLPYPPNGGVREGRKARNQEPAEQINNPWPTWIQD